MDALKHIAEAQKMRSLKDFELTLKKYENFIKQDKLIERHIVLLYDQMLEQNLLRIIEPFSRVELSHISQLISLPVQEITNKLAEMILDKKFKGTLDQGSGLLIVFHDPPISSMYEDTLECVKSLSLVVDSLTEKVILSLAD